MDLGECPKVHDLAFRADYENAAKNKDYFYDIEVSIVIFYIFVVFVVNFLLPKEVNAFCQVLELFLGDLYVGRG